MTPVPLRPRRFEFPGTGRSTGADCAENLLCRGHVPRLLLREHQFPVGKHVQNPAAAKPQLNLLHAGLGFQFALQAPGLTANVGSKKTALDFNLHDRPPD